MKTGSRSISRNTPVTILDVLAVLHGYRRSLEADFLYTLFLPLQSAYITFIIISLIGNVMVLEVEGCRSSAVRALVAKASGSGFDFPATTKIVFTFCLCFF